jgi:hypothetical protein
VRTRLIPNPAPAKKGGQTRGTNVPPTKTLTEGQKAYEAKRAKKAGMTLDKWLASKRHQQEAEAKAKIRAVEAGNPPKAPGLFSRLLERAQRPLGS